MSFEERDMKYKKFVVTAAIVALLLTIACIALYYKSSTEEKELTSKRNAILDYLKKKMKRVQIRRSSQRM